MKQRRYKVCHLITRLELGGAQQNTLFCTAHHDRSRFDVELIAGRGGILDAEALRIPDADVRLMGSLRHPIAPGWDALTLLRLRRHFKAAGTDLVHTHSSKAGVLGRVAAHLAGVPVVVHTVHGWSFNPTQPPAVRRAYASAERSLAHVTNRLVVVSAMNRAEGLDSRIGRPGQYAVIHSGIDRAVFERPQNDPMATRRSLGFGPEHTVVGTVACMKPQKAPLDFVHAAATACAADPSLRFFLAGDGVLSPRVEERIAECGLKDRVRLLGWRDDVPDLLHASDIFLLTSLFEGLPRAVLQAMAARVPVVATAVDGTPEVVQHERTGLLVPPGQPDRAAEQVLRLAADPVLRTRLAHRAADRLGAEFDIRQMVHTLDALYLELLEGVELEEGPYCEVTSSSRASHRA